MNQPLVHLVLVLQCHFLVVIEVIAPVDVVDASMDVHRQLEIQMHLYLLPSQKFHLHPLKILSDAHPKRLKLLKLV